MNRWMAWGLLLTAVGCQKEKAPPLPPDNVAVRYGQGLAAAPAQAQAAADEANRVIAQQQALMERAAQEAQ
ncbi:MAG: hypothetical protein KBG07_03285 [Elusimicrobia bacterium]|nr:hypothetical protein [Elusimicrobiota bacterium]